MKNFILGFFIFSLGIVQNQGDLTKQQNQIISQVNNVDNAVDQANEESKKKQ